MLSQQLNLITTAAAATSASTSEYHPIHTAGIVVVQRSITMAKGDAPFANRVLVVLDTLIVAS